MKAALAQGRASQAGAPSASAGVEGPLSVFSAGEWRYSETGQTFSAKDLDEAAFVVYRASQAAAPVGVPDGWVLVPMEPPQHALDYLKVPAVGNWHGMLALMPVAPRSAALRTGGGADHG